MEYFGHVISAKGIQVNPKKIEAVNVWETAQNVTQVQSFLGLDKYYRRFGKDFPKAAAPLSDSTKEKLPFQWKLDQKAFKILKEKLTSAPILRCPDPNLLYELTADAF